ncbi:hypothetical protein AB0H77_39475, partial [Streptomyces sp. NPDC050844]
MRDISRRGMLGIGAGAAAALGLAGCGTGGGSSESHSAGPAKGGNGGGDKQSAKPIGDGSTAFTGQQPRQPAKPVPL